LLSIETPKNRKDDQTPKIAKFTKKTLKKVEVRELYNKDAPKQVQFRQDLLNMVVGDCVAFSTVERPLFRQLVHNLDSKVRIPSARTLVRDMQKKYSMVSINNQQFPSRGWEPGKIV
jgi:hypothetical protein